MAPFKSIPVAVQQQHVKPNIAETSVPGARALENR